MRLARIAAGDIVEVNDGLPYLASVIEKEGRVLIVQPHIDGRRKLAPRHVKSAWIVTHYRKVQAR